MLLELTPTEIEALGYYLSQAVNSVRGRVTYLKRKDVFERSNHPEMDLRMAEDELAFVKGLLAKVDALDEGGKGRPKGKIRMLSIPSQPRR